MKYIIDLDALKDCLELLGTPHKKDNLVSVEAVNKMIDKFPKEEYKEETKKTTTATKAKTTANEDILDDKGKSTGKK